MSSTLKIVLIVLLALAIGVAGYFGYQSYTTIKSPKAQAIEAISSNTVFFTHTDDLRGFWYNLTEETDYWKELAMDSNFKRFSDRFISLDSVISTNTHLNEILELNRFTVSLCRPDSNAYDFVFILEFPPGDHSYRVESLIKESVGQQSILMKKKFEKAEVLTVNLAGLEKIFYCTMYKGLFLGSFNEKLVQASVSQLNKKRKLSDDPQFSRVYYTAGKNVDANIFINLPNFTEWSKQFISGKLSWLHNLDREFASWSEIDLIVNKEDLLINGYTVSEADAIHGLSSFKQSPQQVKVPEILPYNVAWMVHFGLNDVDQFLSLHTNKSDFDGISNSYHQKYKINLSEDLVSWVGNEIVVAATEDQLKEEKVMVVLQTKDLVKAALSLNGMIKKVNRKEGGGSSIIKYNDYSIRKLGLPSLFKDVFGDLFPVIENSYFVAIREYIVFAPDPEMLKSVIDHFYDRKTLAENFNYKAFSDNISDRSNIFFYYNLRKTHHHLSTYITNSRLKTLVQNLGNFEGAAVQFSFINDMFYTNIYVKYNPEYKEVNPKNWEATLDANMNGIPHLVNNFRNGKLNVIVFDELNNMYLIDHMGRIQWKVPLIEDPVGDVHEIDYYENGKIQFLFNTASYLYLIDLNGNYVADYPVKLPARSTSPPAVFDYGNNREYRILLALEDNKIHNFDKQGAAIEGWNKIQASGKVLYPVQRLVKAGKDYLFVSDENGRVSIHNRRGETRIKPKKKINKAKNSNFYENKTNNKGYFITTNHKGQLVYIGSEGAVSRTSFGDFGESHFFDYLDFDKDDSRDFCFVDGNKFVVFDRFKKVILEHQFSELISYPPVLCRWGGSIFLGFVLPVAGEIQLFDHNGRRFSGQYFSGSQPFALGSMNNDNVLNLIVGEGDKLICTMVE